MQDISRKIRQAEREGWATYMPTPILILAGALASLAVLLSPILFYAVVIIIAVIGEKLTVGWVDWYATVYVNWRSFVTYVVIEWPYVLGGTALGVPLALLRQRFGFYHRHVKGVAGGSERYKRRFLWPIYPHTLVLYLAGPLILLGMAYHAAPLRYPKILFNMFAVWLTSGVVAALIWDRLQVWIVRQTARWVGPPYRNLAAEFELKSLIEEDPALSYYRVWDVAVNVRTKHAVVYGNVRGDGPLRRLKELAAFIDGVETLEVTSSGTGPIKVRTISRGPGRAL